MSATREEIELPYYNVSVEIEKNAEVLSIYKDRRFSRLIYARPVRPGTKSVGCFDTKFASRFSVCHPSVRASG